jgi:hypothetical protein
VEELKKDVPAAVLFQVYRNQNIEYEDRVPHKVFANVFSEDIRRRKPEKAYRSRTVTGI